MIPLKDSDSDQSQN